MSDPKLTRRMFLRGVGGASLALPILPSLLSPREAHAQSLANNRIFIGFTSSHGCRRQDMYPAASTLTQSLSAGGHTVKRGALAATISGSTASVSNVLSAPSSELTAAMVAKMNVLQGLDMTWDMDHHYGMAAFGNIARSISFNGDPIHTTSSNQRRSIDQVMAWSPAFYTSLAGVPLRSVTISTNSPISWGFSNPEAGSGSIQSVNEDHDSRSLFDDLFPTPPSVEPGTPLVNLVVDNYRRLVQSNRRLSAADRVRVEEHMQRMSELQRRLTTINSCEDRPISFGNNDQMFGYSNDGGGGWATDLDRQVGHAQMFNEVLALAAACGSTRVAVIQQAYPTSFSATQDWNQFHDNGPGHFLHNSESQGQAMAAMKRLYFSKVVLHMAGLLEKIDEGNGKTALDRAVVLWQDEHGHAGHSSISVPAITFGSADGFLKTGNYCDYRNQAGSSIDGDKPGLTYHQHWGTLLQAMGVPRSEYQEPDHDGYGKRLNGGGNYPNRWPDSVWNIAGEVLPFLKA